MAGASAHLRHLAVVGSPIAHSLSPALHSAAFAQLGLDWEYGRHEVAAGGLGGFVASRDEAWRGLSVTAPLKAEASAIATELDPHAQATQAVNTLLLDGGVLRGWNTDVGGIIRAFADAGLAGCASALVIGAGATAQSAVLALASLGARRVFVALRDEAKGTQLVTLGERLGCEVALVTLHAPLPRVDVAVSTLPAMAEAVPTFAHPPSLLLDADYARAGGSRYLPELRERVLDGREMLLGQAVLQVRVFVSGDVDQMLRDEDSVVAAMRAALARGWSAV